MYTPVGYFGHNQVQLEYWQFAAWLGAAALGFGLIILLGSILIGLLKSDPKSKKDKTKNSKNKSAAKGKSAAVKGVTSVQHPAHPSQYTVRPIPQQRPTQGASAQPRPVQPHPVQPHPVQPVKPVEVKPVEEVKPVQPVAEVVEEVKPVQEVAPVQEAPAQEETLPIIVSRSAEDGKVTIKVRYNRSFVAKLMQAPDFVKDYYSQVKNEILRYKKIHDRQSWRCEKFNHGRKLLVKLALRGKALYVYLALNPADYAGTKYKIVDKSSSVSNASVPLLYKVKNDRRCRYVKELIADVMKLNELVAGELPTIDYISAYPYEETIPLIDKSLIKLLKWADKTTSSEVGLISIPEELLPANAVEADNSDIETDEEREEEEVEESNYITQETPEGSVVVKVRYNKSFVAKLMQAPDFVKDYYSQVKNEILRYKKVHDRRSWRCEKFNHGRKLLVKLALRGKALYVYLALNPADYVGSKYKFIDKSESVSCANVPLLYKVKNDRRCRYVKELIADVMKLNELTAGELPAIDYASAYPYEDTPPLVDRKLIKLVVHDEKEKEEKPVEEVTSEVVEELAPEVVEDRLQEAEEEVEESHLVTKETEEGKVVIKIRYNKSFTAKLIQSEDTIKGYYSEIKNELLRYKKIHDRLSWRCEKFNHGRTLIAKLGVRGKSLYLYLALNPKDYLDSKYKIVDKSSSVSNANVPLLYKIKNDRRCRYAKELIAEVMKANELVAGELPTVDYVEGYPYEDTPTLINKKLIKLLIHDDENQVTVEEHEHEEEEVHYLTKVTPEGKVVVRVRYNKSFVAKLIQSPDVIKDYYSQVKNEILRYDVHCRHSWKGVKFNHGRKLLIKMSIRGKSLCVFFALNPNDYIDSKYKFKDVSDVATNAATPLLYKVKNDRRCRYVKELIADVMKLNELAAGELPTVDYAGAYPYEELEPLIERKLVKVLIHDDNETHEAVSIPEPKAVSITVEEAEAIMNDDEIVLHIHTNHKHSDVSRKAVVNVDTLAKHFNSGDFVTIEELRHLPEVGPHSTFIKVLGRGVLDKALTVEADDFSPSAVKMIVLCGGKVIRHKDPDAEQSGQLAIPLTVESFVEDDEEELPVVEESVVEEHFESAPEVAVEEPAHEEVAEVVEESVEEVQEVAVEEPAHEEVAEVVEESVEEVQEVAVEEPAHEEAAEVVEESVEDVVQDVADEPVQEVIEEVEVLDEPVQEVVEEVVEEEPVQEAVEQVTFEEKTVEVADKVEEVAQEQVEEVQEAEDVTEEYVQETIENAVEEQVEEVQEVIVDEEVFGEAAEEVVEEPVEEVAEEVVEESSEEVLEEVAVASEVEEEVAQVEPESQPEEAVAEPESQPEEAVAEPEPQPEKPKRKKFEKISLEEANVHMKDEEVEQHILSSHKHSDRSKKAVVNVDTLGKYFNSGDVVTLESMKKKGIVAKHVTCVKILARGVLTKALTIEADDFTNGAVKMIVLCGGQAVRHKKAEIKEN